jgi:chromosome segregation ATPase
VSFRITRHTEDLAQTLHALSQRLVAMEKRLDSLDEQLVILRQQQQQDRLEGAHLAEAEAHIERLLLDCRELLATEPVQPRIQADGAGREAAGPAPDGEGDELLPQAA